MSTTMSRTRRMTMIAMLSAISTILANPVLQFVLIPNVNFMKVELTIIPILFGVFTLGLLDGYLILIIRSVLWMLLFNQGPATVIGMPMNMIALGLFMLFIWIFIHKKFTYKAYILGSISAIVVTVLTEMVMNLIYAIPLYAMFAHFDIRTMFPGGVKAYLLGGVLPFNTLEGIIFAVIFAIIFSIFKNNKIIGFKNV